ncbi:Sb-PDE family phosphodiesterase [Synoicihabitans lomoniglobus]|uniref:Sb-PDE family phosphodiesterase n=1 Tax=Synoicihabitans lomoniglobus TaxID=2909285 RepID=A0AAE9ZY01_9BACT|nr:Sb-PDE family phosphodiesterase [Opitutaceae bacterium LMO-M01]WED65651.1 Sb-PDE family phosphodiesterase [Opitutaceae bacterium LMO-M01]
MPKRIPRNLLALAAIGLALTSPVRAHDNDPVIHFPDLPDLLTLVCDFHQHTVFSDGAVWPDIRVKEGIRDGLDVMAVTDHLEYQPHRDDIPHPDRNRSFDLALAAAKEADILVVRGAEVTRRMPPGHINAIFLQDVNRLIQDDPLTVMREAVVQGGFLFWNHPAWTSQVRDGVSRLTDMHRQMIEEGLLHGIEVINEDTYSESALQIALDHNLVIMGTSDIHGLIAWDYEKYPHTHRPVTLVFAEDRTAEAVRTALMDRRTVVWYADTLIGREAWMQTLLHASLSLEIDGYDESNDLLAFELTNHSDAPLTLRNAGIFSLYNSGDVLVVPPHETRELNLITKGRVEQVNFAFEVLNALTAPRTHPVMRWENLDTLNP